MVTFAAEPAFSGTGGVRQVIDPDEVPYAKEISSASFGTRLTVTDELVGRVRSSVAVKCEPKSGLSLSSPDSDEVHAEGTGSLLPVATEGTVAGGVWLFSDEQPARKTIPITRKQMKGPRRVLFTILLVLHNAYFHREPVMSVFHD